MIDPGLDMCPTSAPEPHGTRPQSRALRPALLCALVSVAVLTPSTTTAAPAATRPSVATIADSKHNIGRTDLTADVSIDNALRALDRLHSYGYTINTPTRADRAIRHWQHANGLTVDGIIGPDTLASLDLGSRPGEPTATAPVPAAPTSAPAPADGNAAQIIRDVWPDELEDRALAIAFRESRNVPTARNACCYGLFQIHWGAHRAWLAGIGITSPAELLDARTNATAALALYQAAGWGPWSL